MKIVEYPHPSLFRPTREVRQVTARLKHQVEAMFDAMYEAGGMALAANQVALPYRLVVINPDIDKQDKECERAYLNPTIVHARGTRVDEEGCLSFPGLFVKIRRAAYVDVQAYDLDGRKCRFRAEGLEARAWQHELDHLDGKLFVEHFSFISRVTSHWNLKAFESRFRREQRAGRIPSLEEIERQLDQLERGLSPIKEQVREEVAGS